jgi:hypothetical protein
MRTALAKAFALCASLLATGGCVSSVVHTFSMPVKNEGLEFGKLPDKIPGTADVPSSATRPELYNGDFYFRFEMSNALNVQDEVTVHDSNPGAPLLINVNFGLGKNRAKYKYEVNGTLFLPSGEVLQPSSVRFESPGVCSTTDRYRSSTSFDLKNGIVEVSDTAKSGNGTREPGDNLTAPYGCIAFRYAKPVSVNTVFSVDFGKVITVDGKSIPMRVQFYPFVLRLRQK